MNAATFLIAYAVALTYGTPWVLSHFTRRAASPRLGVTAWVVAAVTALAAWVAAAAILVTGAGRNIAHSTALTFCVNTLGPLGRVGLPQPAAAILMVALTVAALAITAVIGIRVAVKLRCIRRTNYRHAAAATLIGRPTEHPNTVVVTARQPAAYCVGGRLNTIVVTSAAFDALEPTTLAAIVAHERAHLRGRHHHILTFLTALATALPRLPLFAACLRGVTPLLEMCADDAAARIHGPRPLLIGLSRLTEVSPGPATALGAANTHVLVRATRLVTPARGRRVWQERVALTGVLTVTAVIPAFAALFCLH